MDSLTVPDKVCDIGSEDDEWKLVEETFSKYMSETRYCHTAVRLGPCQMTEVWKAWKCAEMQAKYYSFLYTKNECFDEMKGGTDFPSLYNYFCGRGQLVRVWVIFLVFGIWGLVEMD